MIAANTSTAQFLESHGFARCGALCECRSAGRASSRWRRRPGRQLPADAGLGALEQWLLAQKARDPPIASPTSRSASSSCSDAASTSSRPPNDPTPDHFGLAVDDYAHCTAPNRRFADLVTQRLVKAALTGRRTPYPHDALTAIAARCSEREDAANRVERQVRKAAAAMVLAASCGEVFDAVVTGAVAQGHVGPRAASDCRGQTRAGPRGASGWRSSAREADSRRSAERVHRFRGGVVSGFAAGPLVTQSRREDFYETSNPHGFGVESRVHCRDGDRVGPSLVRRGVRHEQAGHRAGDNRQSVSRIRTRGSSSM